MSHQVTLAVWDLASPVVIGRPTTLKAGIACPSGCDLTGVHLDICDETGRRIGGGVTGAVPWPDTRALHWVECEVAAPDVEGEHAWSVQATAPGTVHEHAASIVHVVASKPPEHTVTLEVIETGSGVPLAGVELRLGAFRAATNDAGVAQLEVPRGTYELCGWKLGYALLSATADIASDATIRLEVTPEPQPEQPYWM